MFSILSVVGMHMYANINTNIQSWIIMLHYYDVWHPPFCHRSAKILHQTHELCLCAIVTCCRYFYQVQLLSKRFLGLSSHLQELHSYTLKPSIWRKSKSYQWCKSLVVTGRGVVPTTYPSGSECSTTDPPGCGQNKKGNCLLHMYCHNQWDIVFWTNDHYCITPFHHYNVNTIINCMAII
jgi:hypothetical protein